MIKHIGTVKYGEVFHFKHSLRPFIQVSHIEDDNFFVDIDNYELYTLSELLCEGYDFYLDENDENFYGVEVEGHIEWVE